MIRACIFDLDGVIVDTAKYHYLAWRRLANELGFDFTIRQNEELKGVSRMESLAKVLSWGGLEVPEAEKQAMATRKNTWYREYILQMTPDEILPGVLDFLEELRTAGIRTALGSASKNACTILERLDLKPYFEVVIDGTQTTRTKPDPQVFQLAAEQMGVDPAHCVVFEDAYKGIEAANNGGFLSVGVGDPEVLKNARVVIPGFSDFGLQDLYLMLRC